MAVKPTPEPDGLEVVYRNLRSLVPAERNPRTHTAAQISKLANLMREHGFTNPILVRVDETSDTVGILAGHARQKAAELLGFVEVPTINLAHLTDEQARAYIIADNRAAEDAGWDEEALAADFAAFNETGYNIEFTGFDMDQAQEIMRQARRKVGDPDGAGGQKGEDENIPEEPLPNPTTRPGDIWELGPHRLICADTMKTPTFKALIAKGEVVHLVATDPPYAIYGSATGIASDISDDGMVRPFFERILTVAKDRLEWFGHCYVCCDWRSWPSIWESAKATPSMEAKNLLIWDKGGAGLGSNYANTYECVAYFAKLPKQKAMGNRPTGQRAVHRPNVLRYNRPQGEDRLHNAAKPVALFRELIENSTGPGDTVLDPFCGSGTTIIACDQTDRICLAVDNTPGWCDVTIERFWRLRELEPLLEGTVPFSQVRAERQP